MQVPTPTRPRIVKLTLGIVLFAAVPAPSRSGRSRFHVDRDDRHRSLALRDDHAVPRRCLRSHLGRCARAPRCVQQSLRLAALIQRVDRTGVNLSGSHAAHGPHGRVPVAATYLELDMFPTQPASG